jgi:hypothetical protein
MGAGRDETLHDTGPKPPKARHGRSGPARHQSTFFFFFLSRKSGARTMACKRLYDLMTPGTPTDSLLMGLLNTHAGSQHP